MHQWLSSAICPKVEDVHAPFVVHCITLAILLIRNSITRCSGRAKAVNGYNRGTYVNSKQIQKLGSIKPRPTFHFCILIYTAIYIYTVLSWRIADIMKTRWMFILNEGKPLQLVWMHDHALRYLILISVFEITIVYSCVCNWVNFVHLSEYHW